MLFGISRSFHNSIMLNPLDDIFLHTFDQFDSSLETVFAELLLFWVELRDC